MADIRTVRDMNGLIEYFSENLGWEIDLNDFDDIEEEHGLAAPKPFI